MVKNYSPMPAMEESPLVSVIIPAYNAERFIAQTLESVLAQTYPNLEVLVVDDGSQDGTAAIVRQYMQRDDRIKLLQQPNAGVAAARNLGIHHAKGIFIAPLDADDIWYPRNIRMQVQCITRGGVSVGLVYSWSVDIDETGDPFGVHTAAVEGSLFWLLICQCFIGNASATLIRRSCLEKIGIYNTSLKDRQAQGCEDWDLYLRIAAQYEFRVVPEFLVGYRRPSNSMSCDFSQMARSHQLAMQIVRQNNPDVPKVLYRLSASNFFLYFAHQCNLRGDDYQALKWLLRALRAECVTPFLRPVFYKLLIRSGFGLIRRTPVSSAPSPSIPKSIFIKQSKALREQPKALLRYPHIWFDSKLNDAMLSGVLYLTKILQSYRLMVKQ